jgi:hypothetical protein
LFIFLEEQYEVSSPALSPQELKEYTSNRDTLYLLHQLNRNYLEKQAITPKQLYFFLLFVLQKNDLMNSLSWSWLITNFCRFVTIMRNGPQEPPPVDYVEYKLLEYLTRWMLKLATMEGMAVKFTESE